MINDIRYALRGFRRNPLFALTAILVVALGIGATTAVFSVVDRILFRSLPYPHGDRLVTYGMFAPIVPEEFLFGADYLDFRQHQIVFETVTSWSGIADCDLTERNPVRLSCGRVESTFLSTLGIVPLIGRGFSSEDDRANSAPVALLSYGLWQSRFGGDPGIAAKTISLDGEPARVIGVLPAGFEMPTLARADLLVPQRVDDDMLRRAVTGRPMSVLARLKPGGTAEQAAAALQPQFLKAISALPAGARKQITLRVRSLRDRQIHDVRLASWVLLGSVLAVLLIACANVANLLLVRSAGRQREFATRLALGARQRRLIRQCLTESLVLGVAGGTAGVGIAYWLLRSIVSLAPESIPHLRDATLDGRVLAFTLGWSVLSGVLFGLAPAMQRPRRSHMLRNTLVGAQIAFSLVLLTCASLLIRTLWNLENSPFGMRTENVLTAAVSLGQQRYPQPAQQLHFFEQLEERLNRLPGFSATAVADSLPPTTPARSRPYGAIQVEGRLPARLAEGFGGLVVWRAVTQDYFSALGIPILRGRGFTEDDRRRGEHNIVLSQSLARRMFPNEDPLGKRIGAGDWCTIVGVAGDVANGGDPEYYIARSHAADDGIYGNPITLRRGSAVIRTSLSAQAAAEMIRAEIAAIEPTLPVTIETMPQRVYKLAERPRFNAILLGLFAGLGLVLAAVGLYGVISFLVAQRTREIGIRIALGATSGTVARLVLSYAARWTIGGAVVGLLASLGAARLLGSMLYGVSDRDPWAIGVPMVLLLSVALAAAWLPARRAASVDPCDALRHE
jgi:putative ABC transport system permease protein